MANAGRDRVNWADFFALIPGLFLTLSLLGTAITARADTTSRWLLVGAAVIAATITTAIVLWHWPELRHRLRDRLISN
jgi:hypothetical protein